MALEALLLCLSKIAPIHLFLNKLYHLKLKQAMLPQKLRMLLILSTGQVLSGLAVERS